MHSLLFESRIAGVGVIGGVETLIGTNIMPEKFVEPMNLKHHRVYSIVGIFEYCNSKPPSDVDCFNSITPIIGSNGYPSVRMVDQ